MQKYHIVGRLFCISLLQRPLHHHHVVDAEFAQRRFGARGQFRIGLERHDRRGHAGQQRAGVAGAGADVEDDVGRLDVGFLEEAGDHHRLDQIAALGDGNVLVDIGDPARRLGHEQFPGDTRHRVDQGVVGHFVGANLPFDHIIASGGIIGHGNRFLILFRLDAPVILGGAALTGLISANPLKHNGQPWDRGSRSGVPGKAGSVDGSVEQPRDVRGAVLDRDNPARYIRSPSGPASLHRKPAPWRGGRVVMQRTANPYMWVRFPPVPPTS